MIMDVYNLQKTEEYTKYLLIFGKILNRERLYVIKRALYYFGQTALIFSLNDENLVSNDFKKKVELREPHW